MRLVTFGCSQTFGHALPDVWDYKNKQPLTDQGPSKHAWAQLLADKLNLECCNFGLSGAGNKEIWWNAINYDFKKTDIVIVLWSVLNRYCIIKNSPTYSETQSFSPFDKNLEAVNFYKYLHNDFDMISDFYIRCNHLHSFLNNKIKLINHGILDHTLRHKIYKVHNADYRVKFNKILFLTTFFPDIKKNCPAALDNSHPGLEAHTQFAEEIYNEIKNEIT